MRRVIFNKKGGVGKSTITCNLAAIAAAKGQRTLVIDLDPQCNSTHYLLGSDESQPLMTAADYFESLLMFSFKNESLEDCIQKTPFENLDIVPANDSMEELESKLAARYKMYKMKEALQEMSSYDRVYIDTPPALNFFTRSALIASQACLIPFDCDDFSKRAVYALLENVREIREDHNQTLEIEGIVVNQYQARARLPDRIVSELIDDGLPVLNTFISSSVKVRESHSKARPLIHLAPRHKLTGEFEALYQLLEMDKDATLDAASGKRRGSQRSATA